MGFLLRRAMLPMILAGLFAAIAPGCGSTANEEGVGDTKGVAPANAPKSQAEFHKQQLEQQKSAKARKGARSKVSSSPIRARESVRVGEMPRSSDESVRSR